MQIIAGLEGQAAPAQTLGDKAEQTVQPKKRGKLARGLTGLVAVATAFGLVSAPGVGTEAPSAQAQTGSSMGSLGSSSGGSSGSSAYDLADIADALGEVAAGLSGSNSASKRTFTVNGKQRSALIAMPKSGQTTNLPVVFMFGGWQHDANEARSYANFENTAAGQEAMIVYPEPERSYWGGESLPAWGGAPYANQSRDTDVAFFRHIVNTLASEGKIDRNRVYAAGLSNGGGMALGFGCAAPDVVKGVVGVSGAYYDPTVDNCASGSVPTMIIHGTADGTVAYEGGRRHGASYKDVDSVARQAAQRNKCNVARTPTTQTSGRVTTYHYQGCSAPTVVKKVKGGNHTWYGSSPNSPVEAWNFFTK